MSITVGTAPDSFGVWFAEDPHQMHWSQFLDEVAECGYPIIEMGPFGYLPTDPDTLKKELAKRKLSIIAGTVICNLKDPAKKAELERQTIGACEVVKNLGGKYIVLIDDCYTDVFTGEQIDTIELDKPRWDVMIKTIEHVGDIVRNKYGLTMAFHPHAQTHVEREDQIEVMLSQTDPSIVTVCLDTGHHSYCGGEPVSFMKKIHKRVSYLHFKSADRELRKKVDAEKIPFGKAVSMGIFTEPSKGAVDFPAFRDVLKEVGYSGYAVVEQDMYPAPLDKPLPIAKRTRAYLQSIGLG